MSEDSGFDLRGKTALVTGAGKRIGRAIAMALAREGANIAVHYRRSAEESVEVCRLVEAEQVKGTAFCADLTDPAACQELVACCRAEFGAVEILVNSASVFQAGHFADLDADSLFANLRVNTLAPFLLGKAFASQWCEGRGERPQARILNFLDSRITDYDREHVAYHLSKRMLHDLTKLMALEFAPNVTVNAVAPGLILPPEGRDQAYLESLKHTNPLDRVGSVEETSRAALFLLCSEFITGQVVFVDGGRHLRGGPYG